MKQPPLLPLALAALAISVLAACSGKDSSQSAHATTSGASSSGLASTLCASPDASKGETQGSLEDEKTWLAAFMAATYYWADEIPARNASDYSIGRYGSRLDALQAYYFALLSPAAISSSSGSGFKDSFSSLSLSSSSGSTASQSTPFGFHWVARSSSVPREFVVSLVDSGTPAANAGVTRGMRIKSIDGVAIKTAAAATLSAALNTSDGNTHEFVFTPLSSSSGSDWSIVLPSGSYDAPPVFLSSSNITSATATPYLGYIALSGYSDALESQFASAITAMASANSGAGVTDLILDLRYLSASIPQLLLAEIGYMVGGSNVAGKVFLQAQCNSKKLLPACDSASKFLSQSQGYSLTAGASLPSLNLSRIYLLTGANVCRPAELLINAWRGAGVTVALFGPKTCGQLYATADALSGNLYTQHTHCGITYTPAQYHFVNASGSDEGGLGFQPAGTGSNGVNGCLVAYEDYKKALGNVSEDRLAAALYYYTNSSCPSSTNSQSSQ